MFDVGFSELVLIFVLGLLILGPERLPRVAAQLGRWVGKARHMAMQLRRQLERELEMNEIKQPKWPPPPQPKAPTPAPPPAEEDPKAPEEDVRSESHAKPDDPPSSGSPTA